MVSLQDCKSSTNFCWGKGGNVASARWQVTLYVIPLASSRSDEAVANCYDAFTFALQLARNQTTACFTSIQQCRQSMFGRTFV